jgi:eukaryotic-like serine/threonine-protein kinase
MRPGDVIADRFELQAVAGVGGMGTVYRAADRASGALVALKVVAKADGIDGARFAREVDVLAELTHPAIVRYVAHGSTPEGTRWLAMEWLAGQDLKKRLSRGPLSPEECVALARRVTSGLSALHACGIVHRDLKPSNLFLVGGAPEQAKILDFGIARRARPLEDLTSTGILVGTPYYMAPEQARGERLVDARADVFALGTVLYECAAGRRPFEAEDQLGVLLKIVLEEPPELREIAPLVPDPLRRLISLLLQKQAYGRPADAAVVATLLDDLETGAPSQAGPSLGLAERRVMSLVVASASGPRLRNAESLREVAEALGGQFDVLADGSVLVTFATKERAPEMATRAARCAMELRRHAPDLRLAIVTDRSAESALPMGPMVDRALRHLAQASAGEMQVDEISASLLVGRFEIAETPGARVLVRELADAEVRTLLGRPSACVGRKRELLVLSGLLDECVEERAARVALVVGEAGIGKSRVRYELVRGLADRESKVETLLARADPIQEAPFRLVSHLLRSACGILASDDPAARCEKLDLRVHGLPSGDDDGRILEFLGELVGAKTPRAASSELVAARANPLLMNDQVGRAYTAWLARECRVRPVLVVLEDLHWADAVSVEIIDRALGVAATLPLMVLALARPEVTERFKHLWERRALTYVTLTKLSPRAGMELARSVLPEADQETLARIVELSGGNAFCLEELLRRAAEGGELPEGIVAMLDSRIAALAPDARRVLRAASVFGNVFWGGGISQLLGGRADDSGALLDELIERELISSRATSRFAGERELVFRHSLVREAALRTLTEEDASLAHRLAAAWLEAAGEDDAQTIARHLELGGVGEKAVDWWRKAAERALAANDWASALEAVERAVAAGVTGRELASLKILEAVARGYVADNPAMRRAGLAAMELLEPGSAEWGRACEQALLGSVRSTDWDSLNRLVQALRVELERGSSAKEVLLAACRASLALSGPGKLDESERLRALVESRLTAEHEHDAVLLMRLHAARAMQALARGNIGAYHGHVLEMVRYADDTGDARSGSIARTNVAFALNELGSYEAAEAMARQTQSRLEPDSKDPMLMAIMENVGVALLGQGNPREAAHWLRHAIARAERGGDRRMEGTSRANLARAEIGQGNVPAAERQAAKSVKLLEVAPPLLPFALAVLAEARLARGDASGALLSARQAVTSLEQGRAEQGQALARLMLARCLHANGDLAGAEDAIAVARNELSRRAAEISDEGMQKSFLERVRENALTFELAAGWIH